MKKLITLFTIVLSCFFAFKIHVASPGITGSKLQQPAIPMVLVQGGVFNMGSNDDGPEAKPIHKVKLNSFYIGKYEVTQAQWKTIMGTNPSFYQGCDECPVEQVSYDDVQAFITKLIQKTGKHYRLPTEAEWEYAARGGNKSKSYVFSGSNNLADVAWFMDNSNNKTSPKGQKKPNELEIYDMTGNVWEWCSDYFDDKYYATSPAENPKGPETGTDRVIRGAARDGSGSFCHTAYRFTNSPNFPSRAIGFRLVMVP